MLRCFRLAALFAFAFLAGSGCGSNKASQSAPPMDACSGQILTGTMQDSLTGKPLASGSAVLETGTQLAGTILYQFSPTAMSAIDASGNFKLCASSIALPSALVLLGVDGTGKAYPPFFTAVTGATDLGIILMGGCTLDCGFEGQQQTSSPAVITGNITSAPSSISGLILAQLSEAAPDGSKNLWDLAIPSLDPAQSDSFTTASEACSNSAPYCSSYTVTLPTQKVVTRAGSTYTQQRGAPTYSMYAPLTGKQSCLPPFGFSATQQVGSLPLEAIPGALLQASDITFSLCH